MTAECVRELNGCWLLWCLGCGGGDGGGGRGREGVGAGRRRRMGKMLSIGIQRDKIRLLAAPAHPQTRTRHPLRVTHERRVDELLALSTEITDREAPVRERVTDVEGRLFRVQRDGAR